MNIRPNKALRSKKMRLASENTVLVVKWVIGPERSRPKRELACKDSISVTAQWMDHLGVNKIRYC